MSDRWESVLKRWQGAGLIDTPAAERIRQWESTREQGVSGSRLTAIVFALGGLLLAAGVFLFVAAHWDTLAPEARFALVLTMVAVFHASGAVLQARLPALAMTLHAVGTAALGAGIFLAGQIFNMAEHWPAAVAMWAIGAAGGLFLLRDWPHVMWVAMLVPAWLAGEWMELQTPHMYWWSSAAPGAGLTLLALTYLFARRSPNEESSWRNALARLGAVAVIPAAITLAVVEPEREVMGWARGMEPVQGAPLIVAWAVALLVPAAVAAYLRGRDAVYLLVAVLWVLALGHIDFDNGGQPILGYLVYALGAAGVVFWGLKQSQKLAVNVGVLGFALTIAFFYFSSVFDKLGRSLGLIGMGVLFIGGGWLLEHTRRRLLRQIGRSVSV